MHQETKGLVPARHLCQLMSGFSAGFLDVDSFLKLQALLSASFQAQSHKAVSTHRPRPTDLENFLVVGAERMAAEA